MVGAALLLEPPFEVAVPGEHRAHRQLPFGDRRRDGLRERARVADARRAAVAHEVEAQLLEVGHQAGLMPYLEQLRFHLVGYGCPTCIGNSGPLPEAVSAAIAEGELAVCSVLSGNRNFEGRLQQEGRANHLASPPLVVAYALAGRIDLDLQQEPLGTGKDGKPVYLRDIWPSAKEVDDVIRTSIDRKSTRLNSSHGYISYAVFCLKKKKEL